MKNTRFISIMAAIFIVYIFLRETELYTNLVLDTHWKETRNDIEFKRTSDPFNTCSPESFPECKKPKMEHLSRY